MQLYRVAMSRVGDLGSTRDRPIVCFSDDDASAEAATAPGRAAPAPTSSRPAEVIVVDDIDGSVAAMPDQKRRRTDTPVVQAGAAAGQPPMQVWLKEVLERYPNVRVRIVATIDDSQIVSLDNATAVLHGYRLVVAYTRDEGHGPRSTAIIVLMIPNVHDRSVTSIAVRMLRRAPNPVLLPGVDPGPLQAMHRQFAALTAKSPNVMGHHFATNEPIIDVVLRVVAAAEVLVKNARCAIPAQAPVDEPRLAWIVSTKARGSRPCPLCGMVPPITVAHIQEHRTEIMARMSPDDLDAYQRIRRGENERVRAVVTQLRWQVLSGRRAPGR